jgi:hypothetical protein
LKTFLFSPPCKTSHLPTTNSTQRSLELYTGFYTACNSEPLFFFTPAKLAIQKRASQPPHITSPASQQHRNPFRSQPPCSEALDYSTVLARQSHSSHTLSHGVVTNRSAISP